MADNENMIPVYFIGVHYPPTKTLTYTIKKRVYQPQMQDGKIVVGGMMKVDQHDVKALIDKARIYKRGEGFFETFTTDPSIAAAVRSKYESGKMVGISARMTLGQANALLTPEENKAAIVESMTVEELKAVLARKLGDSDEPEPVVEKSVDKQPEKSVEPAAEKPEQKSKGKGRPAKDSQVVDELLK